jgi:probable rRNA maturation factor
MTELNRRFRQKNKTTDVLSFSTRDAHLLGSIVIDIETAKAQADDYGHSLEREIHELFIHGALHLLGMDHQTKRDALRMKEFETFFGSILDQVGTVP